MTDKLNRRKFLRGTAVAGAATLATPAIADGHATTLKMQAAWGGGIFLENAQSYVDRVHAMAGKSLKIDLLAVNSVVKTSQMQDAVPWCSRCMSLCAGILVFKVKNSIFIWYWSMFWLVITRSAWLGKLWWRSGTV